jgi:hypothetical protein
MPACAHPTPHLAPHCLQHVAWSGSESSSDADGCDLGVAYEGAVSPGYSEDEQRPAPGRAQRSGAVVLDADWLFDNSSNGYLGEADVSTLPAAWLQAQQAQQQQQQLAAGPAVEGSAGPGHGAGGGGQPGAPQEGGGGGKAKVAFKNRIHVPPVADPGGARRAPLSTLGRRPQQAQARRRQEEGEGEGEGWGGEEVPRSVKSAVLEGLGEDWLFDISKAGPVTGSGVGGARSQAPAAALDQFGAMGGGGARPAPPAPAVAQSGATSVGVGTATGLRGKASGGDDSAPAATPAGGQGRPGGSERSPTLGQVMSSLRSSSGSGRSMRTC